MVLPLPNAIGSIKSVLIGSSRIFSVDSPLKDDNKSMFQVVIVLFLLSNRIVSIEL